MADQFKQIQPDLQIPNQLFSDSISINRTGTCNDTFAKIPIESFYEGKRPKAIPLL